MIYRAPGSGGNEERQTKKQKNKNKNDNKNKQTETKQNDKKNQIKANLPFSKMQNGTSVGLGCFGEAIENGFLLRKKRVSV